MPETNKIAILLATYNGEKYIADQIDSILAQHETGWELYIHDDGSADCTPEIIKSYERREPKRIHVLGGPACGGAKENFFYLLRQVQAPYVMFCDQDDFWMPMKIELTLEKIKAAEKTYGTDRPILVFSDLSIVDGELHLISERMSVYQQLDPTRTRIRDLVIQNVITGCTVMINRALAERALLTENTDDIIMHDWWCALVAASFGRIGYIDKPLVLYRQHSSNSVGAKSLHSPAYLLRRLSQGNDIKASLRATQKQADCLTRTFAHADPLLLQYRCLNEKNKLERLSFYVRNGVWKCGWKRNLGLLIWG